MNENKIKTYCSYSLIAFVLAFVVLCCLPLTVYADGINDGSGGESGGQGSISLTQFPLPYGGSSGIGYGDYPMSETIASGALAFARTQYPYDFTLVCMSEVASNNSYVEMRVYTAGSDFFVTNGNDYPSFGSLTAIRNNTSYGSILVRWDGSAYTMTQGYSYTSFNNVYPSNWCYTDNGVLTLYTDRVLYNYPLYYSGGTISGSNGDLFIQYIPPAEDFDGFGFGEMTGTITPASGVDSPGFNIDFDFFVDMNPLQILGEEIRDGIGSLIDKVEDGFSTVIGAIGDTFTMLQNNTQTLISKVQELASDFSRPTSEQIQDALEDSEAIGGLVGVHNKIKGIIDTLTNAGIEVPDAEDMEFDLPFHWQNYFYQPGVSDGWVDHTTTVHISFAWYESIRSKVLIVIYTFMAIGFAIYLFKQIPAILQGMAGSYSAGKSVSDVTANSGTDSYGYKNGVKTK